jgi:RNA polymerase sigma factor (sigma-70 family)
MTSGGGQLGFAGAAAPWLAMESGADPRAGEPLRPEAGNAGGRSSATGVPSVGDLYKRYSPSLFWVCLRYVRSREDAEDMVNVVFLKVQKNLASFKGDSGIYTWIYRIAVNECIQLLRRRKFQSDEDLDGGLQDRLQVRTEEAMDAKLTLQKLFAETDPETVEILFLLYMEGLTQEEVVEKVGISRATLNRKVSAFKVRAGRFA